MLNRPVAKKSFARGWKRENGMRDFSPHLESKILGEEGNRATGTFGSSTASKEETTLSSAEEESKETKPVTSCKIRPGLGIPHHLSTSCSSVDPYFI